MAVEHPLKRWRLEGNYSLDSMADYLGVSTRAVRYWSEGERMPSLRTCAAIQKMTNGKVTVVMMVAAHKRMKNA